MFSVTLALMPGLLVLCWQFGWGILFQIVLAVLTALCCEALALYLRRRSILSTLGDGSAILTALLLAVSLPPLTPWWVTVTGSAFAILVAKQLYGGLGYNIFNPAMAGYAVLLVSFPKPMSMWPVDASSIDLLATGRVILGAAKGFDGLSAATPLDALKSLWTAEKIPGQVESLAPLTGGSWAWVNLGFLVGGLWLLRQRLIDWRIPTGFLGCFFLTSLSAYLIDPVLYPTPLFQLSSGATLLGAFFIVTDPVTAATTPKGRWIYAGGIGFMTAMIRLIGAFPDGLAFAVLLMNFAVPTIDHYTRPRVYGTRS